MEELQNSVWTSAISLPKQDGSHVTIPVKTSVLTDSTTISGDGLTSPIGLTSSVMALINDIVTSAVQWNSVPAVPEAKDGKVYGIKDGEWVNVEENVKVSAVLVNDVFVTNSLGKAELYDTYAAGTPIETVVTDILKKDVNPAVKMTISPSTTVYEQSTTATLDKISVTATAGSEPITGYSITAGSTIITPELEQPIMPGQSKAFYTTSSYEMTGNTTIKTSVNTETTAATASKSVSFVWPYFYGTAESTYVDLTAGTKLLETKSNKTVSYTDLYHYYWFASDKDYGEIKSFKDAQGDETAESWVKQTSATYNGHSYNVYITTEDKGATAKITFAY